MSDEPRVTVGHIKPSDLWKVKDEVAKAEYNSRKFWDKLNDDRRAVLVLMVRDALLKLLENPDAWLPTSLEPESGDQLDLKISIRLPVLSQTEMRKYTSIERVRNHAAGELLAALEKLGR